MWTDRKKTICSTLMIFFGIMTLYCVIQGMSGLYPFGKKLNLLWDQDIQYVDYFAFYRDVLLGKADIGYSFSKSLGGSLVALFGYYLGCPLNLLVVFFEREQLPLFIFLLTMLKMGLSGVTMSVFIRNRFPELDEPAVAGISTGYGLMQYTMLQCSNIMWLDGVILLPLLLLAVYRFITEKRKIFLFVMVLFSIAINWYTGYMTCLFAVCYFLYERILAVENWSAKEARRFLTDGMQCAALMLLGLGGSAAVFYPVFRGLQNGKSVWDPTIFYPEFYDSFWDIFRGFVEGSIVGTVSLYCGTVFFIFFLYFFISRQVKTKEKILTLIAVLFMFVSCWFVPLDCIWSGMRRVASFRFRYSFVVVFLVLYVAARGIILYRRQENTRKAGGLFLGVTVVFVLSHVYRNYEVKTFWATLCTLIVYTVVYFAVSRGKVRAVLLGIILAVELTANGVLTFAYNYQWNPEVTAYQEYASQAEKQAELVHNYDDSVFYRMETVSKRYNEESRCSAYLNDSMAYDYHGIAHYSSTFDTDISNLIYDLGYSSLRDLSIYTQPVLPSDSLLGIKYVLSRYDLTGLDRVEELGTVNEKNVYLNPYALGLGMEAADTVYDEAFSEAEDPFEIQNQLFSNILGEDVEIFKQLQAEPQIADNVLSFSFPEMEAEDQLYGCVNSWIENLILYVDGEYRCNYACWLSYRIFDIGMMDEEHGISFENYTGTAENMAGYFYYLDRDVFDYVMERLGENPFETEVFEDGYVEGIYRSEKAGNLLLTIPYDEGWEVRINEKTADCTRGANGLTVIPVPAGENHIVLRYHVPGKTAGIVITLCSVFIMAAWCCMARRRKKR
ncbi:MAG TPA: YfhO family protein [Candidatus Mediterraneibacter norfolkensis]|nr:YfhO family protein [Candidatus Mediterraneibacter norfolkensis]